MIVVVTISYCDPFLVGRRTVGFCCQGRRMSNYVLPGTLCAVRKGMRRRKLQLQH